MNWYDVSETSVKFNDYFWGEKTDGFNLLYQNMKYGAVACKELADFLKEISNIEENNSKLLRKLAKQAGSCCTHGTFAPVWQILKTSTERLSTLHWEIFQDVTDLVKKLHKYAEDLQKRQKEVKEEETEILEAAQVMQLLEGNVQKSRDACNQRNLELMKLRKECSAVKDIEKAELKLTKAHEYYKMSVDKYSKARKDFDDKMFKAYKNFQDLEAIYLVYMKNNFLVKYADVIEWTHRKMLKVHLEFKQQCNEITVDKLLQQFVESKSTGLHRPRADVLDLEDPLTSPTTTEAEPKPVKREGNGQNEQSVPTHAKTSRRTTSLLNLFMSNSQGSRESRAGPCSAPSSPTSPEGEQQLTRHPNRGSKWFLRSRRDKTKQKKIKKKSKDSVDNQSNKEDKSDLEEKDVSHASQRTTEITDSSTQELDEDGYVIRPEINHNWNREKGSFYSSSDSDSDDDRERKIRVEIKPLNNSSAPMSASVDELRATVENLYLSSTEAFTRRGSNMDIDPAMKRSQSVSQQLGKPSSDLLGLHFTTQSPTPSNASTPTSSHPYAPLQSPSQLALNSPTLAVSRYAELKEIFSECGELQPPPKNPHRRTPTPTSGYMSIPRPHSRVSDTSRNLISQSSMSRADSINSLEFRTASVPIGVSRGPSPLTIGMADAIPLAVAFHEIVHSYFRGADESRCQVKMSGEMMLSFPAGIVTILANNPYPAKLSFRIKNTRGLSNILPNHQLVYLETGESNSDVAIEFNMFALSSLLKKQSEDNPNASYFNVDILKYQIKSKAGANSCPFQLVAYWKCSSAHTDLKIDYKYNSHAMSSPTPLLNVTITVPVPGIVKNMQTKSAAQWTPDSNKIIWKFTELSQYSENHGVGSVAARYDVEDGPGTPQTVFIQFNCEGTTLSGIDFQLSGPGYRLSLVKRRFIAGKYICDGDQKFSSGTGTPSTAPTVSSVGDQNW